MNLSKIQLSHLVASSQPRPLLTAEVDKLAASIKEVGLIHPIIVTQTSVIHGSVEPGWKIVAGHHRVAACRALGWTEIDALVIDDVGHLQTELIEIDENLCRSELTTAQRSKYTKRRAQIWEALNPSPKMSPTFVAVFGQELADSAVMCDQDGVPVEQASLDVGVVLPFDPKDDPERDEIQVDHVAPPEFKATGYKQPPPQTQGFAAATAAATGQSKATTNRALARAKVLTDDDLDKLTNTSLDSGVELDALAKMPAPERAALVERAAAGEQVSARPEKPAQAEQSDTKTPIKDSASSDMKWLYGQIKVALRGVLDAYGCLSVAELQQLVNRKIKTAHEDEVEAICDTIDYLEQWTRALSGIDVVAMADRK